MEFQDRILNCVDSATEFIWTAGEPAFFADKNFKNEPKRCKACKGKRAARPAGGGMSRERVETQTMCSACGKATTAPVKPAAGPSCVLQRMLPVRQVCGGWQRLGSRFHRSQPTTDLARAAW